MKKKVVAKKKVNPKQKLLPPPKDSKTDAPVLREADPMAMIEYAVKTGNIDIVSKMMDLFDRVKREQAEMAFRDAMSRFQAICPSIKRRVPVYNIDKSTGKKTTVRYRYAPLDDIVKQIKQPLEDCGLSYKFNTVVTTDDRGTGLSSTCTVSHILGHSEATTFWVPFDKDAHMTEIQKWGDTRSYANRYCLCDALGITTADEDHDGNDPDDAARKAEELKRQEEMQKKVKGLNEDIKKGFGILGYNFKTIVQFCEDRSWDEAAIKKEINKILDKQA